MQTSIKQLALPVVRILNGFLCHNRMKRIQRQGRMLLDRTDPMECAEMSDKRDILLEEDRSNRSVQEEVLARDQM
jgi:hypothetical protein